MTSSIASLPSVQISTVTRPSGPAPFCCNDPGCSCQGGKDAKAALDLHRLQENLDSVSISSQALQLLTSERPAEVGAAVTAQAVPPADASLTAAFSTSAFTIAPEATLAIAETGKAEGASGNPAGPGPAPLPPPDTANAAAPPLEAALSTGALNDPSRLAAYQSVQQLAETDKLPPPTVARVDTYA